LSLQRAFTPETAIGSCPVAANVDAVFVMAALERDFNPRRIERALALVWESGAQPVLVLSKADLCDDVDAVLEEASSVALGVPAHALSALLGEGIAPLEP
jgi:ribosome biogenesis GTPase / thiamine phosphate phosphatase